MASLAASNRHLSTPAKRKAGVRVTVATSSAIEGIRVFKVSKKTKSDKDAEPLRKRRDKAASGPVKVKPVRRARSA
jgi:hypothetical protein